MITELKTTRITCDHCSVYKDITHLRHKPIISLASDFGFYTHDAGEHYTGDCSGGTYHFTFHFCSHECKAHVKQIKADRIREIYRKEFKYEKR